MARVCGSSALCFDRFGAKMPVREMAPSTPYGGDLIGSYPILPSKTISSTLSTSDLAKHHLFLAKPSD
jgi:hypothetical protein